MLQLELNYQKRYFFLDTRNKEIKCTDLVNSKEINYLAQINVVSLIICLTRTCSTHVDSFNNTPCDLVSVYKGSFVACTGGPYCMNNVVHEEGNVKTFKRFSFRLI